MTERSLFNTLAGRKWHSRGPGVKNDEFHCGVPRQASMLPVDHFRQHIAWLEQNRFAAFAGFNREIAGQDIGRIGHWVLVPIECGVGGDLDVEDSQLRLADGVSVKAVPSQELELLSKTVDSTVEAGTELGGWAVAHPPRAIIASSTQVTGMFSMSEILVLVEKQKHKVAGSVIPICGTYL